MRPQDVRDLYTLLGVARGASDAEVRKAYRKLSRTVHPDKGGSEAEFQDLQRAYEVLSNGDLRFLYDLHPFEPGRGMDAVAQFLEFEDARAHHAQMMMAAGGGPPGGGMPGGPFAHHHHHQQQHHHQHHHHRFQQMHRNPMRGEEDHRRLDIDLADAYTGRTVRVTLDRIVHCRGCRDSGAGDGGGGVVVGGGGGGEVDCALCQRERCPLEKRVVERPHPVIRGMTMTQEIDVASGERCRREHFELDVPVPRGATDGHAVVFPRASHHFPGIIPGDLVVHLHLKEHPFFARTVVPVPVDGSSNGGNGDGDSGGGGGGGGGGGSDEPSSSRASDAAAADADDESAAALSLDLRYSVQLSLVEALLGFNRTLRHLDGSPLLVSSSPSRDVPGGSTVTPHRHNHVVKGRGMPPPPPNPLLDDPQRAQQQQQQQQQQQWARTTRDGRRPARAPPARPVPGNLLVEFAVVFPDGTLSDEAKAKIRRAFATSATDDENAAAGTDE